MAEIDASTTRIGTTLMRGMPAETRWRAGDLGGAAKDVERALADAAERGERFWVPELLRLMAELAIARGAPAGEALALLDEAIATADAQGEAPLAARARAARDQLTNSRSIAASSRHASHEAVALSGQVNAGRSAP